MATGDLSLKITVEGTAYYVSDDEYVAEDGYFHYGYVLDAPVMTIGATRGDTQISGPVLWYWEIAL